MYFQNLKQYDKMFFKFLENNKVARQIFDEISEELNPQNLDNYTSKYFTQEEGEQKTESDYECFDMIIRDILYSKYLFVPKTEGELLPIPDEAQEEYFDELYLFTNLMKFYQEYKSNECFRYDIFYKESTYEGEKIFNILENIHQKRCLEAKLNVQLPLLWDVMVNNFNEHYPKNK